MNESSSYMKEAQANKRERDIEKQKLKFGQMDWKSMPLPDAIDLLSELKRQYDKAASIVLERQQAEPKEYTCWVWQHKQDGYNGKPIPKKIVDQCKRKFKMWIFRDDSVFTEINGIKVRTPVTTCSPLCSQMYQLFKNDKAARERGAPTSEDIGIELRTI